MSPSHEGHIASQKCYQLGVLPSALALGMAVRSMEQRPRLPPTPRRAGRERTAPQRIFHDRLGADRARSPATLPLSPSDASVTIDCSRRTSRSRTMNRTTWFVVVVSALVCTPVEAQQFPIATTAAEVPGPPPGTAMTKAYVQTVGRAAYLWGWALVNAANRAAAFAKVPEPGLLGGVVPVAFNRVAMLTDYISPDEHFVTCPNQDVVYGFGYADLEKEPLVFQVPDFGDRFWAYALYDARTDEFSKIGKAYGTKPGFYLMVGPNWKGETPAGITAVVRSSTPVAFAAPRIFMDDTPEDHQAIQPALSRVNFYPLAEFEGYMKVTDWSKL